MPEEESEPKGDLGKDRAAVNRVAVCNSTLKKPKVWVLCEPGMGTSLVTSWDFLYLSELVSQEALPPSLPRPALALALALFILLRSPCSAA